MIITNKQLIDTCQFIIDHKAGHPRLRHNAHYWRAKARNASTTGHELYGQPDGLHDIRRADAQYIDAFIASFKHDMSCHDSDCPANQKAIP